MATYDYNSLRSTIRSLMSSNLIVMNDNYNWGRPVGQQTENLAMLTNLYSFLPFYDSADYPQVISQIYKVRQNSDT
jgi:hypothetical protein